MVSGGYIIFCSVDGMAGAISSYHQANLIQQAQTSVLANAMDVMRSEGDAAVALIQSAASVTDTPAATRLTDPALGTIVDTYA